MSNIQESELRELFLKERTLIDVRAPVEFAQGSLPGAVNIPIMNDDERARVGLAYKSLGREKAVRLGHELVCGELKEARIQAWMAEIKKDSQTVIYCFRGGLRSQITQSWLKDRGVNKPLIVGGYKKARHFLMEEINNFSQNSKFVMLTGPTGSAKTQILNRASTFYPSVDLEALAHHRGSAFGAWEVPQPSQIDFENRLAVSLIKLQDKQVQSRVLLEDESRMIGRCTLPENFFFKMRASPVLYVEEKFDQRVENIFQDYVIGTVIAKGQEGEALGVFSRYRHAVQTISRKLGGLRAQEVLNQLASSEKAYLKERDLEPNKAWIATLLSYYYDPLYAKSLAARSPQVLLRGTSAEILEHLRKFSRGMLTL
ncbi:MAG TPA: tRNA 2-selenouridine(34) synthase MnmH [Pseudobdellovibrionaceae bacterium]